MKSQVPDGASAIGWDCDAINISNSSSKVMRWKAAGVPVAWVDVFGQFVGSAFYSTGDWTNIGARTQNFNLDAPDGAAAVAASFDSTTLANATAKLLRWRNNSVEKRAIGRAGQDVFPTGGADAVTGKVTLVGGGATVATTSVKATSRIFLSVALPGGVQGILSAAPGSITPGVSFVIFSTSGADTSDVFWRMED
jgi:hypothetical protein